MNLEGPARETAAVGQPRRAPTGTAAVPFVSIIIPCRNERAFIAKCLDSILRDGFPLDRLEVLVVDGRSDDGTRDIVEEYSARFPCVRLLDNPRGAVPPALNIGIARASGDVIMRMDAHAELERGYITGCLAALDEHNADNVGGVWKIVPRSPTAIGRAFVKHNWTNGKWAILPYLHAPNRPVSWRHLVPLTFVVGAMSAVGIALVQPSMTVVPAALVGAYGTACVVASAGVAWRERDIRYLLLLPWVFASLHVSYGLGSVAGVTRVVSSPRFWGSWWRWNHGRPA